MRFVKAQVNGNDFVIIMRREDTLIITNETAKTIADRHFGIGCDQVIELTKVTDLTYNINFFNADGGHAEMCGNGVCAASLYISRIILSSESAELRFIISGREHRTIADKGEITLFVEKPILLHRSSEYQILSVGNKHAVCDIKMFDSVMEVKDKFPDCNLHFTKFVDDFIRVKTYERGVGWTRACGSGAIAIAASQNISDSVRVVHDGGCSSVRNLGDTFSLTVHPKIVFSGNFYDD